MGQMDKTVHDGNDHNNLFPSIWKIDTVSARWQVSLLGCSMYHLPLQIKRIFSSTIMSLIEK